MRHYCALALLLAVARPVLAADSFPINVYPCQRAEAAPALDGKLDDAVWQQAPLVSGFTLYESGQIANPQTSFRVLWDDRYLYLGVRCEEPLMENVSLARHAQDEHDIFRSETIEFFVDPDHTHARYYQLAFSVAGSLYDGAGTDTAWDSGAQVKTCAGADFWSAEVAVPWESLKTRPQSGKVVGFNLSRDRSVGTSVYSAWTRVDSGLGFHDPDRFAHLVLSGTPEQMGKLSEEFRKGGRTGAITVFSAEGFAQTTYAQLAAAAFANVDRLMADLDRERVKGNDPAAAAEIKQRLDDYAARLAAMKAAAAGSLDAAEWTRLDLALQELTATLHKTVGEARLKALLDRI
ncbi:MAG: carbohydrate-binding family 9-like protein [Armatimonadota bacterium]